VVVVVIPLSLREDQSIFWLLVGLVVNIVGLDDKHVRDSLSHFAQCNLLLC
jgi:hypothetical protein